MSTSTSKLSHGGLHALACVVLTLAGIASAGASDIQKPGTTAQIAPHTASDEATVERGRYLTVVAGCNDCHTPFHMTDEGPAPDMSRMFMGHPQDLEMPPAPRLPEGPWIATSAATNTAWAGPWGVSFTTNLTPDVETGIGSWSEKEFVDSMRSGRHRGKGRVILPPMPWPNLAQATDEDLAAIFAYLQQVPAIHNRVPDPLPPESAGVP